EGVRRPGLAHQVLDPMAPQRLLDGGHGARAGLDLTTRRQVVVRCTLVPHRRMGHDHMPAGDLAVEHACAPAGAELAATERDHLLQQTRRQRSAQPRVEDSQPLAVYLHLVDGVDTHLTTERMYHAGSMLLA